MYDMYPWNRPGGHQGQRRRASRPAARRAATAGRRAPAGPATRALQVALDRRDNGGASPATGDQ
ncbi:MAG TPA: hypothetical protein VMH35_26385 [Streptosporangiaceae bacterium]|nr:hypothetical protein [Streptosporangiaceae bacterium]